MNSELLPRTLGKEAHMSKEKILDKYEKENRKMDEGQRVQDIRADLITLVVIILLSAIAFYVFRNIMVFAMIIGILFTGFGCGEIYRYFNIRKKHYLITGVVAVILGLLFYGTFLSQAIIGNLAESLKWM